MDDSNKKDAGQLTAAQRAIMEAKAARRALAGGNGDAANSAGAAKAPAGRTPAARQSVTSATAKAAAPQQADTTASAKPQQSAAKAAAGQQKAAEAPAARQSVTSATAKAQQSKTEPAKKAAASKAVPTPAGRAAATPAGRQSVTSGTAKTQQSKAEAPAARQSVTSATAKTQQSKAEPIKKDAASKAVPIIEMPTLAAAPQQSVTSASSKPQQRAAEMAKTAPTKAASATPAGRQSDITTTTKPQQSKAEAAKAATAAAQKQRPATPAQRTAMRAQQMANTVAKNKAAAAPQQSVTQTTAKTSKSAAEASSKTAAKQPEIIKPKQSQLNAKRPAPRKPLSQGTSLTAPAEGSSGSVNAAVSARTTATNRTPTPTKTAAPRQTVTPTTSKPQQRAAAPAEGSGGSVNAVMPAKTATTNRTATPTKAAAPAKPAPIKKAPASNNDLFENVSSADFEGKDTFNFDDIDIPVDEIEGVNVAAKPNVRRSGVLEVNERVYETVEMDADELRKAAEKEARRKAKAKSEPDKAAAKSLGGSKKAGRGRAGSSFSDDNPGVVAVKNAFPWEKLLIGVALVVFVIAALLLGQYYISTGIERQNLQNVASNVLAAQEQDDGTQSADARILQQYSALAAQNRDMVGWLSIADTTVNAPVMYTPKDPEYYLNHDFEKNYSQSGMLFMDATCVPDSKASNMVIYGHNMKNKTMFADLENYVDAAYLQQHPLIRFDSLSERAQYEIFAVFELDTSLGNENALQCYYYRSTSDLPKHAYFLDYVREYALIELEDKLPAAGDTLITLSTCDNVTPNGRVVIMAKKISSTNAAAITEADTASAAS